MTLGLFVPRSFVSPNGSCGYIPRRRPYSSMAGSGLSRVHRTAVFSGQPLTACPGYAFSPASGGGISSRAAPFSKIGKGREKKVDPLHYASALASDTPKVSTSETGNTSGADILYQDTDGGQISVDGKNWVAEADYEKNNAAPDVQWWTADEYEAWMNEQKKEMESLIGTGDGWYDGQGVFHEFTQESVDAMMDSYKETLESIKKGVLYSKDDGDGDTYSMIPPTEDVVSSYSVDVTKDNGKTVHIGDYSTVEELDKAISDAVKNGQLTQEEADSVQK